MRKRVMTFVRARTHKRTQIQAARENRNTRDSVCVRVRAFVCVCVCVCVQCTLQWSAACES